MRKIKTYVAMVVTGVMMLSLVGCNMIERTPEAIQKTVIAKVENEKITKGDLDKVMKPMLDGLKQKYGENFEENVEIKEQLKQQRIMQLNGLVDEKVLLAKASALGVNPSEEELNKEIDDRIAYYKEINGTEEQYQKFISEYGYDDTTFRDFLKNQVIVGKVVDAMVADVQVSDEDAKKYYDENIDRFKVGPGAEVTHLLFKVNEYETDEAKKKADYAKALENAKKAREKALAGTSLEDLSNSDEFKEISIYEDLGHVNFENSGMVKEFEDAFKVLPKGQISEPVKTNFGYHLILNTDTNSEEKTQSFDEVKDKIKQELLQQKQQAMYSEKLDEYKKELNVKVYDDKL